MGRKLPNAQTMKLDREGGRVYLQWKKIDFGSDSITSNRWEIILAP